MSDIHYLRVYVFSYDDKHYVAIAYHEREARNLVREYIWYTTSNEEYARSWKDNAVLDKILILDRQAYIIE